MDKIVKLLLLYFYATSVFANSKISDSSEEEEAESEGKNSFEKNWADFDEKQDLSKFQSQILSQLMKKRSLAFTNSSISAWSKMLSRSRISLIPIRIRFLVIFKELFTNFLITQTNNKIVFMRE